MTADDLLLPTTLKRLCAQAQLRPSRASGQHYLIHRATRDAILHAIAPSPADTVIEVGAGFGVLTLALAPAVRRLIAIEREHHVVPILRDALAPYANVEVMEADILHLLRTGVQEHSRTTTPHEKDIVRALQPRGAHVRPFTWKLVANLPYGITSDFLRLLLDGVVSGVLPPPQRAVLLLQREVVDRLTDAPGDRGLLTIVTALHCHARRIAEVPPTHFWPQPKVRSAVVLLDAFRTPADLAAFLAPVACATFLTFLRRCFAHPRRQLAANLRTALGTDPDQRAAVRDATGLTLSERPAELTLAQWCALARAVTPRRASP